MRKWREVDWDKVETVDDVKLLLRTVMPDLVLATERSPHRKNAGDTFQIDIDQKPEVERLCKEETDGTT